MSEDKKLRHNLEANHIVKRVYNPDSHSYDVTLKDTEISMELNHLDGDSVYSIAKHTRTEGTGSLTVNMVDKSKATIYVMSASDNIVSVEVSPDSEGDLMLHDFSSESATNHVLHTDTLCSRLKVTSGNPQARIVVIAE